MERVVPVQWQTFIPDRITSLQFSGINPDAPILHIGTKGSATCECANKGHVKNIEYPEYTSTRSDILIAKSGIKVGGHIMATGETRMESILEGGFGATFTYGNILWLLLHCQVFCRPEVEIFKRYRTEISLTE
jgi:hypothetical protein